MAEGYGSEHFAPGHQDNIFSGYLDYVVLHQVLITVATVSKVYNEEYKNKQKGTCIQVATVILPIGRTGIISSRILTVIQIELNFYQDSF